MTKPQPLRPPSWLLEFVPVGYAGRPWHGLVCIDVFRYGIYTAPLGVNWVFALALSFYRLLRWPSPFAEYGYWADQLLKDADCLAEEARFELRMRSLQGEYESQALKAALARYATRRNNHTA